MLSVFIAFATIYCWTCLFVKRFHDAGTTGWYFPVVFMGFLFLALFVVPLILGIFIDPNPEALEAMERVQEMSENPTGEVDQLYEMFDLMAFAMQKSALLSAANYFIAGAIVAYGVNHFLKTDPNPNRWG